MSNPEFGFKFEQPIAAPELICQMIVDSSDILNPVARAEFAKQYLEMCPVQEKGEGGLPIGTMSGTDADGIDLTVKILYHRKINDQIITFIDQDAQYKVSLREDKPKLLKIEEVENEKVKTVTDLDEDGLRYWLNRAIQVYFNPHES